MSDQPPTGDADDRLREALERLIRARDNLDQQRTPYKYQIPRIFYEVEEDNDPYGWMAKLRSERDQRIALNREMMSRTHRSPGAHRKAAGPIRRLFRRIRRER